MLIRKITYIIVLSWLGFNLTTVNAQISPGDLTKSHADLEGLSNCTQCHILGDKVSNDKCLDCHKELKSRVNQSLGYHASSDVKGKDCFSCHSEHHGREFEMIRFNKDQFDHNLTGYKLEGAHAKKECIDCHKKDYISSNDIKKKKYTYMGLKTECLSCHEDYHQKTLSNECANCHNFEKFKPAPKFDHDKADYKLVGKHKDVECAKCHKMEVRGGKDFQAFKGLKFESCVNCHQDVHNNKFGPNCSECHTEFSFRELKTTNRFDHDKTDYKLEGKHQQVDCKLCHKVNYTDPIWTSKCTNCHRDYHNGDFKKDRLITDCQECHTVDGFNQSSFTVEKHNESEFKLNGAHLATPCFACHKKDPEADWKFRSIGKKCADCHEDIHQPYLNKKYYPESACKNCHTESRWSEINFDHNQTEYKLQGAHEKQTCRSCHFKQDESGPLHQQFADLPESCVNCHIDIHFGQFEKEGQIDCFACHDFKAFKPASRFDHDKTLFSLKGAHEKVACKECHKPTETSDNKIYIQYKIDNKCESCHK